MPRDIDKYMTLSSLQERNERLFYRTVIDHLDEIMPLIYTPTVGEACREFSHIAREPKGFFITPDDRGRIAKILDNWPEKDIRVIVVTDGQRILGWGPCCLLAECCGALGIEFESNGLICSSNSSGNRMPSITFRTSPVLSRTTVKGNTSLELNEALVLSFPKTIG
jgi:hypothetical protein